MHESGSTSWLFNRFSYGVGPYDYRAPWHPGSIDRLREVLRDDPEYGVHHYLAESLLKTDKKAEAVPYDDRLGRESDRDDRSIPHGRLETLAAQ